MNEQTEQTEETERTHDAFDLGAGIYSAACMVADNRFALPSRERRIAVDSELIAPHMFPLIELKREEIDAIVRAVPGGASNVEDIYPLSQLQEGMLFHRLMNERDDTYVESLLFELKSREQVERLRAALQKAVDRHDILRSAVLWEQLPRPLQVIYRDAKLPVEQIELDRSRGAIEQLHELMRPGRQRLELREAPLARLQIAAEPRTGSWYALLQIHHLICDFQSLKVLIAELTAHLSNRADALPLAAPYREYVARSVASCRTEDAERFFRGKLGHVDEPTAPFGVLETHEGASQIEEASCTLDMQLTSQIRAHAERLGVSVAVICHAAWAVVVAHTSGRGDVVFGTVLSTARREAEGGRRGLGMALNTLPLRLEIQNLTALGLLDKTQRELAQISKYDQTPLTLSQGCSAIEGAAPLFTTLLNYRRSVRDTYADLERATGIRMIGRAEAWTNYPITLSVDDGEVLTLTAQTDRQIDPLRMTGYLSKALCSLVTALLEAPDMPAARLTILPEVERHKILTLFNATQAEHPRTRLVHEIFEAQVRRTPDLCAVLHETQSLSYEQLNARSNQLARFLRSRGVGRDRTVAICLNRSIDMVVGLLAILKAGGAYLPLDPNYPRERLQWMLEDAAPSVLLTHTELRAALPVTQAEIIAVDELRQQFACIDRSDLAASETAMTAGDLVYVIFTSGSTGRPKGTAMSHGAMCNLLEWQRRALPLSAGQRVLQFAALSFDVAFQETFSTLCAGGTLVLADEWVRRDAGALTDLLNEARIERLFVPPLMLQSLAEHAREGATTLGALRDVITAGERLRISPDIVDFFERLPACTLHNHYGPTETHVVTALTMDADRARWPALPTIGRPIANTQIYILDARLEPVPIGVVGEIYIGGANLARGYVNRSQLTSERFVENPFKPQSRLYRTGDLGKWLPDGAIEYLGRNDDQVKIRGFRIELAEIEQQLTSHPSVREAAVTVREDGSKDRRLVAYVTSREGAAEDSHALREHLRSVLPEHMVPSAIVVLERFPVTPSGKLNRRALPAPDRAAWVTKSLELPVGEIEKPLAEIWQELLQVQQIGRDDSFFDLGGHSLLAMRLLARIQTSWGVRLHIRALFEQPTLRVLAHEIEELRQARLLEHLAAGGPKAAELLEELAAMSESQVQERLRSFPAEGFR